MAVIKINDELNRYDKENENIGISMKDYFLYDEDKLFKKREEIEILTKKVHQ